MLANHNVLSVILLHMDEKLKRQLGTDLILIRNEPVSRFCLDCNETLNHSSFSVPWKNEKSWGEYGYREKVKLFKCENCDTVALEKSQWWTDNDEWGDEEGRGNNMNRKGDLILNYPSSLSTDEIALLPKVQPFLNDEQYDFLKDVLAAKSQKMDGLAAIGFRSLFEHFFNICGTNSSRDRFVSEAAKMDVGTSKAKNEYKYKLQWLSHQGVITKKQSEELLDLIKEANKSAHKMQTDGKDLNVAIEALLSLTLAAKRQPDLFEKHK